ncbi:MAG: PLP-dependent aminotransferase family protein [Acidimicrobiales bacterium]
MTIQWTGLGPELLLPLDRNHADPLRVQIERGLRDAIRTGRLHAGERLPSTRGLARALGVSRGLVVECFEQLQAEGYLSTKVGSATRVAAAANPSPAASVPPVPPQPRLDVDFVPAVPDLGSFPRADWTWAVRETCRHAPNAAFDYGEARGSAVLRAVLASYMSRVRGAAADPERLVVCTGFSQGLNLVLRALADSGVTRVAFEDPGYDETSDIATAWAGVEAVPVPVDGCGIDVDALAATGVPAVVLTPAHQWPTGVVLTPERRQALVAWAVTNDAVIVEDDYDAEFRYDREPVGVVQGLAPDHVFALGTVSKSLAPTLRLGWILCPPALAEAVAGEKVRTDRGSPGLEQLVLARLIESGRFDRHLRRMRTVYARKRDVLVNALARHAPDVNVTGLAAGFHAVAHLPVSADEQAVVSAARARSVGLYGMSSNRSNNTADPPQLVLGFGNLSERSIQAGIATVGDLLQGRSG